jgi:hypothetical protein
MFMIFCCTGVEFKQAEQAILFKKGNDRKHIFR